mmetsp:Transcript_19968/g.31297  ORF Transcript_19968/g.31297 Transcript_19968/m.31297 type:complete len:112 (-) Transcript_19968:495-830(-)
MLFLLSVHIFFVGASEKDAIVRRHFEQAVRFVRSSQPSESSLITKDTKLALYGLYKQATVGDCDIPQPWAMKVEARAKWEAWNQCKGMTKLSAMEKYVERVQECDPTFTVK